MTNEPFIIERLLKAPVSKVWEAITDKDQMKEWYFDLPEFKPEPGFVFKFMGYGKEGNKEFIHLCEVREAEPLQKLGYSWRYEGYSGTSYVSMEMTPEGSYTQFKLTHNGLESFPADIPDLARGNFAEGWTYIIGTLLENYLKK